VYQNLSLCRCLIFLALFFSLSLSHAQNNSLQKRDSLKTLIPAAKGIDKYEMLFDVAYELFDVDNDDAVKYARDAYELAVQLEDDFRITKSGRLLGQLLRRVNHSEEAIRLFIGLLPIAERNHFVDEQVRILNALAAAHITEATYDKALFYSFKSLEIQENAGNEKEVGIVLNNIGLTYYRMGDFEQALEFYNRAKEIKKRVNDNVGLDRLFINMSLCYNYLRQYEQAKEFVEQGLEICGENCNDAIIIEADYSLGTSLFKLKEWNEALFHFNRSYERSVKVGDLHFQGENLIRIAEIAFKKEEYQEAIERLSEAELLSKKSKYNLILINTYLIFSDLYKELKNHEKASAYQSKYIQLKDSVYSDQLIKNLAKVQSSYVQRENLRTIAQQDEVLKLKEEVISRQRTQYFFILTITVLSVLLTFVFVRFNRSQREANIELTRVKREIEEKNKELEVNNAALDIRVQERTNELQQTNHTLQKVNDELDNFIYRTSHDIRGPLASLQGMTNVAMLDVKDPVALEYFKKLNASSDKLNAILTRLVTVNHINHVKLNPEKINCEEFIEEILLFERKKGIPPKMTISSNSEPELELVTDKNVLRLALENLINNAIKFHSNSTQSEPFVNICMKSKSNHQAEISIIDNGIGIQKSDQQKLFHMFMRASDRSETGGIGLYIAKLAAEKLNGQINFNVTKEGYTQFSIHLPTIIYS
jgi:signal transduction histidine kinase